MGFQTYRPGPPLLECVDYLWAFERSDAPGHARERVLPTGTIELIIAANDDEGRILDPVIGERRLRGGIVAGCFTRAFEFNPPARISTVGVHFKPGGAARLFGVPAGALMNAHVVLTDLWGQSATELHERICAAPTSRGRVALLERALIARVRDGSRRRPAVSPALAELDLPGVDIGRVAKMVGLSRRRFIEIFSEDVGMTPKRYSMVRRFQRAVAIAALSPSPAWSRIATESGYYDQAHMCRDWIELAGLSPAEHFCQRNPVNPNHVVVPEVSAKSAHAVPKLTFELVRDHAST